MTAMAHAPMPTDDEILLDYFLALEPPQGFRAELIDGRIFVSPAPDGDHEDAIDMILSQVYELSKTKMQASGNKGLELATWGASPKDRVIPDITFAPRESRLFRGASSWMPSDGVAMVAEVTSTKPDGDRKAKRLSYARAGIPLYLLVDREKSTTVLFSEPKDGDYTETHLVPFGKPLPLPAPFSFDLDTSEFL
ncbi:Uma2 family endonuclease [Streptomyces varsoviensis]|uniref:Putative restriction endonuclease domain-containing protein n=1 Tax=Streptomyces varsoviensis TaxID=67373 RepID=A0ABR5JA03_9ACTN|nr:Uma2 family endonuclease [Streptomyces varsoviensis]KOG90172.1 hypothetical protein ADK38_10215 [Streptomyces varsoviensis]